MTFVTVELALLHCRAEDSDRGLVTLYLKAAEQSAVDYLNRNIYTSEEELAEAKDKTGIVLNSAIEAAILLIAGHLYTNREENVTGTIVAALKMGAKELLRPHRLVNGA